MKSLLTSAPCGRGEENESSPRPQGVGLVLIVLILSALLLPLVGHGCHGDDVDHEPAVAPPVQAAPTSSNSR